MRAASQVVVTECPSTPCELGGWAVGAPRRLFSHLLQAPTGGGDGAPSMCTSRFTSRWAAFPLSPHAARPGADTAHTAGAGPHSRPRQHARGGGEKAHDGRLEAPGGRPQGGAPRGGLRSPPKPSEALRSPQTAPGRARQWPAWILRRSPDTFRSLRCRSRSRRRVGWAAGFFC